MSCGLTFKRGVMEYDFSTMEILKIVPRYTTSRVAQFKDNGKMGGIFTTDEEDRCSIIDITLELMTEEVINFELMMTGGIEFEITTYASLFGEGTDITKNIAISSYSITRDKFISRISATFHLVL